METNKAMVALGFERVKASVKVKNLMEELNGCQYQELSTTKDKYDYLRGKEEEGGMDRDKLRSLICCRRCPQ